MGKVQGRLGIARVVGEGVPDPLRRAPVTRFTRSWEGRNESRSGHHVVAEDRLQGFLRLVR